MVGLAPTFCFATRSFAWWMKPCFLASLREGGEPLVVEGALAKLGISNNSLFLANP